MKSFAFAAFVAGAAAIPAWNDWSADPAESTPVKITSATTSSATHTWEDWTTTSSDPVKITSTSTTSHTWEDWTTTSSDPVKITSTSSASHTWEDWTTKTSSDPVKITSTTPAVEHTWSDWNPTYTTTVVTAIVTYVPYPTDFTHAGKTYHITEATTITITDCPCTISVPIYAKTTSSCSEPTPVVNTATYSVPVAAGTGVYSKPVSPYETTSAPIAAYTGAANRVANVGAGLAGVAAAAAFLL